MFLWSFFVNHACAMFLVFLFGHPHLLEAAQWCQYGSTYKSTHLKKHQRCKWQLWQPAHAVKWLFKTRKLCSPLAQLLLRPNLETCISFGLEIPIQQIAHVPPATCCNTSAFVCQASQKRLVAGTTCSRHAGGVQLGLVYIQCALQQETDR